MNFYKSIVNQNTIKCLMSGHQNHLCLSRMSSQSSVDPNFTSEETVKESMVLDKLYKTIEIEARSADQSVLDSYDMFVKMTANQLGVNINRSWQPFRHIYRRTLLRSAFVKKKYRVQYEMRTYFRNIEFKHLTGSTADTFLEYIQRNLPEGVALMVYKTAIEPLPQHICQHTDITSDSTKEDNI